MPFSLAEASVAVLYHMVYWTFLYFALFLPWETSFFEPLAFGVDLMVSAPSLESRVKLVQNARLTNWLLIRS